MCQIVKIISETFDQVILYFFTIPRGRSLREGKNTCHKCNYKQTQQIQIDGLEASFLRDIPPLGNQSSLIDTQLSSVQGTKANRKQKQDVQGPRLNSTRISDTTTKRAQTRATVPILGEQTEVRVAAKPPVTQQQGPPKQAGNKTRHDITDVWHDAETSVYFDAEGQPENFLHPNIRRSQDYKEIIDGCIKRGTLFEDPDFPATDASLMFSGAPTEKYDWLRPKEITKRPMFYGSDVSRCNVLQGELGNCWVVAALAIMAECPELLYKVAPKCQDFGDSYRGVFRFRFWKYGEWIDVVVDDRLPCLKRKLVYARSADPSEFWVPLLEKAYAKMNGSYEALRGGTLDEALVDFTGGCSERFNPRICRPGFLFSFLRRSNLMQSLMGCSIQEMYATPEKLKEEGILANHVYSITKVYEIVINQGSESSPDNISIPMIRLRNPYGAHGAEWKGKWSDGAEEWNYVSDDQKDAMEMHFSQDGEFWMSFDDFEERFDNLEIVNLTPDALRRRSKIPWFCAEAHGQWASGITAGGMETDSETFPQNPQYRINLRFVDVDDPCGNCTMCITLMQKYRRATRAEGTDILAIGFFVYHLEKAYRKMVPVPKEFFKACPIRSTEMFRYGREISLRVRLPRGVYLIVPATAYPNEDGKFLLRVFSSAAIDMCEHDRPMLIRDPPIQDEAEEEPDKCTMAADKKNTEDVVEMCLDMFRQLGEVEISWKKLKDIMDAFAADMPNFKGFNKETVRSAATLVDENRNGRIDIHELEALIKKLIEWRTAFEKANTDKTGILEPFHLGQALEAIEFSPNRATLIMLRHRYGREDGSFHFDDFIMCTVKLTTALDAFKRRRVGKKQIVEFRMEDWLHTTIFS